MLDKLEGFTSQNGAAFYGVPRNEAKIVLKREPMAIPEVCPGGIVPFRAGETLNWSIQGDSRVGACGLASE